MDAMEEALREFERQEFGTNDFPTIIGIIQERAWSDAQGRLTGMAEEQAEWEETEES